MTNLELIDSQAKQQALVSDLQRKMAKLEKKNEKLRSELAASQGKSAKQPLPDAVYANLMSTDLESPRDTLDYDSTRSAGASISTMPGDFTTSARGAQGRPGESHGMCCSPLSWPVS